MDSAITQRQVRAEEQDHKLHRSLGFWSLTAAGIGSVIGSGWLFSAMYAAQAAGPAALISWVIAGGLMLMIALVFAELGMVRPESGGLVRYPLYSNGRLAASIIGWAMWLSYVGTPPTEASGVVQYSSTWLHGVYNGTTLTTWGILLAIVLMALFVVVNYFGVQVFAKSNNLVTAVKVFVPTLTVILLLASGFDGKHLSHPGGFAPYGMSAAFGAIATAGLVFTYTGFRNVIELSGEAHTPRRDIPRAMIITIAFAFAIVLYLGLQIAYLGAVPDGILAKAGWHGVNFDSPFADLAKLLGITWLYWLLVADSMVSPSGSAIVYTAANARNVFGLGKNGFFPQFMMKINERTGVPTRALLLNFVVGLAFLLPLPSWQKIVSVLSAMAVLTFAIGAVSLFAFRRVGLGDKGSRLPGMTVIAPLAFVVGALVMYWTGWDTLRKSIVIVVLGLVWFLVTLVRGERDRTDLKGGLWLLVFLVVIYGMELLGSFGGQDLIKAPYDSVVVAVVSFGLYLWGVASGTAYMKSHPELIESLRRPIDEAEDPATLT